MIHLFLLAFFFSPAHAADLALPRLSAGEPCLIRQSTGAPVVPHLSPARLPAGWAVWPDKTCASGFRWGDADRCDVSRPPAADKPAKVVDDASCPYGWRWSR
jgi:hypothetical protein